MGLVLQQLAEDETRRVWRAEKASRQRQESLAIEAGAYRAVDAFLQSHGARLISELSRQVEASKPPELETTPYRYEVFNVVEVTWWDRVCGWFGL